MHKQGREAASFIKIRPFKIQQRGFQAAIMCTSAAHLSTTTATHLPPLCSFSLSLSSSHTHTRASHFTIGSHHIPGDGAVSRRAACACAQ